jgi:hypothetical protein
MKPGAFSRAKIATHQQGTSNIGHGLNLPQESFLLIRMLCLKYDADRVAEQYGAAS